MYTDGKKLVAEVTIVRKHDRSAKLVVSSHCLAGWRQTTTRRGLPTSMRLMIIMVLLLCTCACACLKCSVRCRKNKN